MKKNRTNIVIIILSTIIIFTSFTDCRVIKGLKYLNTKKIKSTEKHYENKTIIFTEIHHAGRVKFYNKLKDTITYYKESGYIVFYEQVAHRCSDFDSLTNDIIIRKTRKLIGIIPTLKTYELFDSLPNFTAQPPMDSLNIDSTDINADITLIQLINQYEKIYGEIVLDKVDLEVPLDGEYKRKKLKDADKIIVDYRNLKLAEKVYISKYNKIIVIYGEGHRKGFFMYLKKFYENQ